jgi:hypothetical protein
MVIPEGKVLEPLNPSTKEDSDSWPEYVLKEARVVSQDTGEPASLLAAHSGFLVRVEGHLQDVDPEHKHLGWHATSAFTEHPLTPFFFLS